MSIKWALIVKVDQDNFSEDWLYSNNWENEGSFHEEMKKHNKQQMLSTKWYGY